MVTAVAVPEVEGLVAVEQAVEGTVEAGVVLEETEAKMGRKVEIGGQAAA